MPTVRCKHDDGDCTWSDLSDRVVVVAAGQLSILTASAAERLFTLDDSEDLEPLDLPEGVSYDEIVDLVLEVRRAESPRSDAFGAPEARRAADQLSRLEARLGASAVDEEDDYLIVYCSCKHRFKKRIQQ